MNSEVHSSPIDTPNHYVLVVHGTWNAPVKGSTAWYQRDEENQHNFCTKLSAVLAKGPLTNSVWRDVPGTAGPHQFSWSGENSHSARLGAAEALADHIQFLTNLDPQARLNFVAHSHGGNVLLKALQIHIDRLEQKAVTEFFGEQFATTNLTAEFSALKNFRTTRPSKVKQRIDQYFKRTGTSPSAGQQAAIAKFLQAARTRPTGLKALVRFWLQRPFTINQSQRKAAWQFIRDWITLPEHNNIGRVAFLGTPFFYKNWRPGLLEKLQNHKLALDIYGYAAVFGAALLVAAFYFQSVALGVGGAGILGTAVTTYVAALGRLKIYRDVNVYFSPTYSFRESLIRVKEIESNPFYEGSLKSQFDVWKSEPTSQIETLVLSGGQLDEALLALTIEPVVRALAAPEVAKLATPQLWPAKPALKVGMSSDQEVMKTVMLTGTARLFLKAAILYPFNLFRRVVLKAPTQSFLMSRLLLVVNSIGTGIAADEFERANIAVRKELVDEQGFFSVTQSDVERQLASQPLLRNTKSSVGDFTYLWDEKALDERLTRSYLWPRVQAQLPLLRHAYRNTPQGHLLTETRTLQRMCVTLDERIKALAGVVEVLHSAYHSHDEIIRDIGQFLESGRIGSGART